jgi:hypothetical protein
MRGEEDLCERINMWCQLMGFGEFEVRAIAVSQVSMRPKRRRSMPREKLLSINALRLLFTVATVGFGIRTATALIQHRLETEDSDSHAVAS